MVKTEVAELSAEAAKPALGEQSREPNKINTATKYRFTGKNLTAYGCGPQKPVRVCRGKPATFRNVRSWATHVEFLELPRCCALLADLVLGCRGPSPTGRRRRTSSGSVGGREPFPAKAVDPVPGAEGQASAGRRVHPLDDGGRRSRGSACVFSARRYGRRRRMPTAKASVAVFAGSD